MGMIDRVSKLVAHQLGFRYRYLMLDKTAEGRADFLARIAKLLEEIA